MKIKDLIPFKHLLITRDKHVYWLMDGEDNLICLSTGANQTLEKLYDYNLMCNRDYIKYITYEPRDFDIIYVYEIVNYAEFMNLFHMNNYLDFNKHVFNDNYTRKEIFTQIFERV